MKTCEEQSQLINNPPHIESCHEINSAYLEMVLEFLSLIISNSHDLKEKISNLLEKVAYQYKENDVYLTFSQNLGKQIPKRKLTKKGREKLISQVLKKLKKVSVHLRKPLEEKKKKFSSKIWSLFYQPENQTKKRKEMLNEILENNPELTKYRELTLTVGSIYRKQLEDITTTELDEIKIRPEYSKELKTAISTLKKYKSSIYRFVNVFKTNPGMGKECRANTEFLNRNFKAPFKQGLNCVGVNHLKAKIEMQMGCKVRWFLSEKNEKVIHQT